MPSRCNSVSSIPMCLLAVAVALAVLLLPGELNATAHHIFNSTFNGLGEQSNGAAFHTHIVSVFGPGRHTTSPAVSELRRLGRTA
jgi:hypothetical protein